MSDDQSNPYEQFEFGSSENDSCFGTFSSPPDEEKKVTEDFGKKIKKRKIIHQANFGRGANHPSFFLRQFFSCLKDKEYQRLYEGRKGVLERVLKRASAMKKSKDRYNLKDLDYFFGEGSDDQMSRDNYFNSKVFFRLIQKKAVELILSESKCNEVLNHFISIQKYSGRLCNARLAGRIEFQ